MLVGGLVVDVVPSIQSMFGCSQAGHLLACGLEEPRLNCVFGCFVIEFACDHECKVSCCRMGK